MSISEPLSETVANQLRDGHRSSYRFHRFGVGFLAVLAVGFSAVGAIGALWGALILALVLFVPLTLFGWHRLRKLAGPEVIETIIGEPHRLNMILKLVTQYSRLLNLRLDTGEVVSLRFDRETEIDEIRSVLADRAPRAVVAPPIDNLAPARTIR